MFQPNPVNFLFEVFISFEFSGDFQRLGAIACGKRLQAILSLYASGRTTGVRWPWKAKNAVRTSAVLWVLSFWTPAEGGEELYGY